jgi:putative proteasome-type protease
VTYCVGLLLDQGIVLLSDTRSNAGLDNIATYRKMFVFENPGDRVVVLMTAGNLSLTQTVIAKLEHEIDRADPDTRHSIMLADSMLEIAEIVGRTLADVRGDLARRMEATGQVGGAAATMLVAGQRRGGQMRLFLLYQEGNFIEATEDTPFLQIGEHKYGKPILDRVVTPSTSLEDGRKAVLLSMDSTLRSNLTVGMPLDLAMIRRDACRVHAAERIEPGDQRFAALSEAWSRTLKSGFAAMPDWAGGGSLTSG